MKRRIRINYDWDRDIRSDGGDWAECEDGCEDHPRDVAVEAVIDTGSDGVSSIAFYGPVPALSEDRALELEEYVFGQADLFERKEIRFKVDACIAQLSQAKKMLEALAELGPLTCHTRPMARRVSRELLDEAFNRLRWAAMADNLEVQ